MKKEEAGFLGRSGNYLRMCNLMGGRKQAFIFILLAGLGAGCAQAPREISSPVSSVPRDAAFNRLAEDFIRGYLEWRPQAGTALGFHQYDGKLTHFSNESIEGERHRLKDFQQRLGRLDAGNLSPRGRYDQAILNNAIKAELFAFDDLENYKRNPMTYAGAFDLNIYIKRNFAPLEARVRSIISIEKEAPKVMAAARANLAAELPKPYVETAIEVANGAASFLEKDLIEGLKELQNPLLRVEFETVNKTAIAELRAFSEYLTKEKLPHATIHYALGEEKYQRMLEAEMISLKPEKILEIGLKALHQEQEIFGQAARQIDSGKPPIEVFKAIQRDHPTAESLLPDARKNLDAIRDFVVTNHLVTMPSEVRARVEETPAFARATSFASMDTPGAFEEKATEAFYFITPVEPDWPAPQKEEWLTAFNYYTTDVVSIHEAYPGHYTQFLSLNASPAPPLEKIFSSYAFVEGWAHYAEQMMLDEGFGKSAVGTREGPLQGAKYRLAQSDEALLRLCRLCVSIKTHCQDMSVEEATRFFEQNCYYENKPAHQEAIRGTFDPGYLYYTLGKLQILKLREDYRKQEGPAFSLNKFHDELLNHGMPAIRLLRESLLQEKNSWNEIL